MALESIAGTHGRKCASPHRVAECALEAERLARSSTFETLPALSYNDLERRMYRMFEFGKSGNAASAQCECQALRIAMGWTGAGASRPPALKANEGQS